MDDATRISVLTPHGRGAVATIGVHGSRAVELVGQCFTPAAGKPLASFAIGRIVFGRFRTASADAEELVVGLVGPEEVEVHCHGGLAAVEAVTAALAVAGCEPIDWQEWTRQENGDLIAAEALIALAEARTERVAAILLDQWRGALQNEIMGIAAEIELADTARVKAAFDKLLARSNLGRHLIRPFSVVLTGRPNVGKSSLINALVGFQRSIVFPEPGTTRDVVTATTACDGWPVELADTAGLRENAAGIEAEGIARARKQVEAADLVLIVSDCSQPWDEADRQLAGGRAVLFVHNKADLGLPPNEGRPPGISVSAKTGAGIEELASAIAGQLVPNPPPPGSAIPFTERQVELLRSMTQVVAKLQRPPEGFSVSLTAKHKAR